MVAEKREMFTLQFTIYKNVTESLIIFGSKLRLLKIEKGLHYSLLQKRQYAFLVFLDM